MKIARKNRLINLENVALVSCIVIMITFIGAVFCFGSAVPSINTSENQNLLAQTISPFIAGTYVGTVAITQPVPLGVLDIAFVLEDNENILSGQVEVTRTLLISGSPSLQGIITHTTDRITPTFRIESDLFTGVIAGTSVQRQFVLEGDVLSSGAVLDGIYSETVTGLLPEPMEIVGIFLASRPSIVADLPTIRLSVSSSEVSTSESVIITATVDDTLGQPIKDQDVSFTADVGTIQETIGTTDAGGIVTATYTASELPGIAIITATTDTGLQATEEVKIVVAPTFEISTEFATIPTGDGQTIVQVRLTDINGSPLSNLEVLFTSSLGSLDPMLEVTDAAGSIATVFSAGELPGLALITATHSSFHSNIGIQIESPRVAAVSLESESLQLAQGDTTTLTAHVQDQFGRGIPGVVISFTATRGVVTRVTAITGTDGVATTSFTSGTIPGQAEVTALAGSQSASVRLAVQ